MKLIKQSSEIWKSQGSLKDIERAARLCYKSEDKITKDDSSAIKLVKNLIERKHYAMLEFGTDVIITIPSFDIEDLMKIFFSVDNFISMKYCYFQTDGDYINITMNPRTTLSLLESFEPIYESNYKEIKDSYIHACALFWNSLVKAISEIQLPNVTKYQDLYCSNKTTYPIEVSNNFTTVKFTTNRGVTHEFVRHNISFTQKSTRFCDETGIMEFIEPIWLEKDTLSSKVFDSLLNAIEEAYKFLRKVDWKPEQAREILPNALKTEIIAKATIGEWKHIFGLRCAKSAHPQMRDLMLDLEKQFIKQQLK